MSYEGYSEEELLTAEKKRPQRADQKKKTKRKRIGLVVMVALEVIIRTFTFLWVMLRSMG